MADTGWEIPDAFPGNDRDHTPADTLPIEKVEPRGGQPRTLFDEPALEELAESIAQHGVLQPITVRKLDGGYYQIVTGERRWRASRLAGLREIPVRIIDVDDKKAQEMALVENLQREDLNPMEEAKGFQILLDEFQMTQEAVARSVGKSRSAIANSLRLLTLQEEIAKMLENGSLTTGHARALLPIRDRKVQLEAANTVIEKELSVRQTEALAASLMKKTKKKKEKQLPDGVDYAAVMSAQLEDIWGRKVTIVDGKKTGRIELEYYGADDREELLQILLSLKEKRK